MPRQGFRYLRATMYKIMVLNWQENISSECALIFTTFDTSMTLWSVSSAPSKSVICHLHPSMSSIDEVFPFMNDIHGWHFHPWIRFAHPWIKLYAIRICSSYAKFWGNLAKIVHLCEQNVMNNNAIHGWANLIHGWKCHQWMSSMDVKTSCMDDIYRWRWQMTDMDGAKFIEKLKCKI